MADESDRTPIVQVPLAPFVPYPVYLQGHLEHERQISINTQRITDLLGSFADMKNLITDTNKKVSDHITDENKTWIDFKHQLDDVALKLKEGHKITIDLTTIGKIIIPTLAAAMTFAYYLKLFIGW